VFLKRLRPEKVENFDIKSLSEKSKGFSGAEIQQGIIEGMFIAFNEKRDFTNEDLILGLEQVIPLSQINPELVEQLQTWALSGRIRLAS